MLQLIEVRLEASNYRKIDLNVAQKDDVKVQMSGVMRITSHTLYVINAKL